jgi:probable phosphoglycerate mutase
MPAKETPPTTPSESPSAESTEKQPKPCTVLLVRHGQNDWVGEHKLAGWTPGVHLNAYGREQATALGKRLAKAQVELAAVYSSPLERTLETAHLIMAELKAPEPPLHHNPGIGEVEYGSWTAEKIKDLAQDPRWQTVQFHPSGMTFPGGESMYHMQSRAVSEINRLAQQHLGQTILLVSHADVIKSVIAHYLGVHLDLFQRIMVSPASVSTISFTPLRPIIHHINDTSHVPPPPPKADTESP